jgi:hypothetical protein
MEYNSDFSVNKEVIQNKGRAIADPRYGGGVL